MPKDRRVNSSSFDRAMMSPYSRSSKISDHNISNSSSPHVGDEREWEEARCPICMEHPHNAVLLLCSSQKKGCRPFICDTSYRHSNCLDQLRKSAAASNLQTPSEEQKSELACPLCRGLVTGSDVIHAARKFMNSKSRSCSLETCTFSGNYAELRKHARLEHPSERPSEASPTRQSNWTIMEQQREIEDALAHQSDTEYDLDGWPSWFEWEDDFWGDGSFFDFPSGMSDIEDELMDEMFSGFSLSLFSLYSSSPSEDTMTEPGSPISSDGPQRTWTALSSTSVSRSNNHAIDALPSSRSRSGYRSEDGATISRSRQGYNRENDARSLRFRSGSHRDNSTTISSTRSEYGRSSVRTRSTYPRENNSTVSRLRSSFHRDNATSSSSYHREGAQPSSRERLRSYHMEVAPPPVNGRSAARRFQGSSGPSHTSPQRRED